MRRRLLSLVVPMLPRRLVARGRWDEQLVRAPEDSERAVEVPWAASAIRSCIGFWLDVGYAYAEPRYWESISADGWRRHLRYGYGLDVAPPQHPNILDAKIVADILDHDFASLPNFNLITCISTLEHLGCDNTNYHESVVRRDSPFELQMRVAAKMARALSQGGRLLVSVPFGAFEDHGWFLQYNDQMIGALADSARGQRAVLSSDAYYELTEAGWKRSSAEQMRGLSYRADEGRAAGVALLEFSRR